jgi:molybdenum cofactor cytidylyltransferase
MSVEIRNLSQVGALVLAAGASSRMGRPKGALPLNADGETVIRRVVRVLLDAGLVRVVVVTGAHPEVARSLAPLDARVSLVHHPGWAEGQLSSLQCGLDALQHGGPIQGALMTLVDVPLVRTETVRRLVTVWQETGAPIVRPTDGVRHGHPVLFDRRALAALSAADPSQGAKPVIRSFETQLVNVAVEDEGAFFDIDTPDDYARALRWNAADPD